jgi:hypothetical protein
MYVLVYCIYPALTGDSSSAQPDIFDTSRNPDLSHILYLYHQTFMPVLIHTHQFHRWRITIRVLVMCLVSSSTDCARTQRCQQERLPRQGSIGRFNPNASANATLRFSLARSWSKQGNCSQSRQLKLLTLYYTSRPSGSTDSVIPRHHRLASGDGDPTSKLTVHM